MATHTDMYIFTPYSVKHYINLTARKCFWEFLVTIAPQGLGLRERERSFLYAAETF